MKIIPCGGEDVADIDELSITIKLMPLQNEGLTPVFYIIAPGNDYNVSIGHIKMLIEGLELAVQNLDYMITNMLQSMKESAMDEMKGWGISDNPIELEQILSFIANLENDDEESS